MRTTRVAIVVAGFGGLAVARALTAAGERDFLVVWRHVAWLRRRQRRTVWASGCDSWYVDAAGLDTHNWPGTPADYRRRTRRVDPSAYRLVPA